jgi:hypothetical protein
MSLWQMKPALIARGRASVLKSAEQAGVCSLADDPTNILMWGHYAHNHTGVCIQFEVAGSPSRLLAAVRVNYSDVYPTFDWKEDSDSQLKTMLFQKSSHWSYERERRIFCPECVSTHYAFNPKVCSGVIAGCLASTGLLDFLDDCNVARERKGWPKFRVYRAHRSATKYKLLIHPLRRGAATTTSTAVAA